MQTIMKINVRQWGNSIGVRIPKIFANETGIFNGTEIEIYVVDNKIVLYKSHLTLKNLLDKVTADNIHAETDTGSIKGKEIW